MNSNGPGLGGGKGRAIPLAERLIVALDLPDVEAARAMTERLGDAVCFYKIGHQLLFTGGLDLAQDLIAGGNKIFLDAKLLDIGQTVTGAVRNIAAMGVDFLTVHGEPKVVRAAAEGSRGSDLGILAVTVLTSLDDADLKDMGYAFTVEQLVMRRVRSAIEAGVAGVIASGREVNLIHGLAGDRLTVVTPGVRSAGADADDQKRIVTPTRAIASGADYIVAGRQILKAADPRAEAARIIGEIRDGLEMA